MTIPLYLLTCGIAETSESETEKGSIETHMILDFFTLGVVRAGQVVTHDNG